MKLLGEIELDGLPFFLSLEDTKAAQKWYLYSQIHPDNFAKVGPERYENSLTEAHLLRKSQPEYLLEACVRSKKTGKSKIYKDSRRLDRVIKAFLDARDLAYPKDSIYMDEDVFLPYRKRSFIAGYGGYKISYIQKDGIYYSLEFKANGINCNLKEFAVKTPRGLDFQDIKISESKLLNAASIQDIGFKALSNQKDLSWYIDPETGKCLKDYRIINTMDDFETYCVTPLVKTIQKYKAEGKKALIGVDTETSGLNVLFLSDTNPDKDKITTLQLSWEDDQSVIIYFDMEHFSNLDDKYVIKRLGKLFKYYLDDYEFDFVLYKDEDGNDIEEVIKLDRRDYWLTGHNTMFDSRVTIDSDPESQFYFDHDTLQMAFNINPTNIKGSKGLKPLTWKIFHHDTPELTDILGKGHEGDFRLLKDPEIIKIYGCADTDYARKLLKYMLVLTPPDILKSYMVLDPITWYLCAQSEYYGMRMNEELLKENTANIYKDLETIREFTYNYVGTVLAKKQELLRNGIDAKELKTSTSLDFDDSFEIDSSKRYEFKMAGADVRRVMYNMLQYPVKVRSKKTQEPAVNSDAIEKLLFERHEKPITIMKADVMSAYSKPDNPVVLIDSKKFNSYKYPLAYLLSLYGKLNKEYTTYYKPFESEDLEGRLFKGISTTNIETRRLSSPAQQMKKSVKAAILSHQSDWLLADWDLAQVEARNFTSLAGDVEGILKLNDPEKDYHTENAGRMHNIPAYMVDSQTRKGSKSLGFGIPYGLGDRKMCERIFTIVNEETMMKTRYLRKLFEEANHMEMAYLNNIRDKALEIVDVPRELRDFWGVDEDEKIGMVKNAHGFFRYFRLSNVLGDEGKEASIRRQAGNYPIQSFAADLFRTLIRRFWERIYREGLQGKFIFHMYIHDEVLFSFHKSVDPRLVAKICAEACMVKLKGHTKYFIGLNFGKSWLDCKKDEHEIPAMCLSEIAKNYDPLTANSWTEDSNEIIMPIIENFKNRRVFDCIEKYTPGYENSILDINKLVDKFENYTVRGYLYDHKPKFIIKTRVNQQTMKEEKIDDDIFLGSLCTLFQENGKGSQMIKTEGLEISIDDYVSLRMKDIIEEDNELDIDIVAENYFDEDELFEDNSWSFDSADNEFLDHIMDMYEEVEDDIDKIEEPRRDYHYVSKTNNTMKLTIRYMKDKQKVMNFIEQYKYARGTKIFIESPVGVSLIKGRYDINIDVVEKFLRELNGYKEVETVGVK